MNCGQHRGQQGEQGKTHGTQQGIQGEGEQGMQQDGQLSY